MLKGKLNKQVIIAGWQLGLGGGMIIGFTVIFASLASSTFGMGIWIGSVIISVCGITHFVLWILGIVNAVAVNDITHDSLILIVFSVLTFWFGHLIVAISQENKFIKSGTKTNAEVPQNLFERKLKQSFIDGVISTREYEQKLKEYKDKQ